MIYIFDADDLWILSEEAVTVVTTWAVPVDNGKAQMWPQKAYFFFIYP